MSLPSDFFKLQSLIETAKTCWQAIKFSFALDCMLLMCIGGTTESLCSERALFAMNRFGRGYLSCGTKS